MVKNIKAALLIALYTVSSHLYAVESQVVESEYKIYNPKVIADRGGVSADSYYPKNTSKEKRMKKTYETRSKAKLINGHFPVVTKSMRVGRITEEEGKDINFQMASFPMFILGYDPVSIEWLRENKDLLIEKNAIGLIVNVASEAQLNEMREIASNKIRLQPTPGDRISEHLKIKHYPFYMDNEGILR